MGKLITAISILLALVTVETYGQRTHFVGLNPSVTVEPFYQEGEFDLNIVPLVYQVPLNSRIDFRASTTVNLGFRESSTKVSHLGGQVAFPIFLKKKEELTIPSAGFFAAPGIGFTRNILEKHSNFGFFIEPGYNLQISEKWSISFGVQLGATHFNYDNGKKKWGNHFGIKIFIGRWL
jgi:hypothetical protein